MGGAGFNVKHIPSGLGNYAARKAIKSIILISPIELMRCHCATLTFVLVKMQPTG